MTSSRLQCASALAMLAFAHAAYPQASAPHTASAPISHIAYDVTVDSAGLATHMLGVTMSFDVTGKQPVVLSLPAWSPGHYTMLWFARRMSALRITQDGAPLDWQMRDFQTWEIHPANSGRVEFSFRYLADAVDRAVAWSHPDFAFFNGTNVFPYPVGLPFTWNAQVTVHTEPAWRVTTSMDPGSAPLTFVSSNYHDLVDRPFFVGRFDLDSVSASDRWIRLATYPAGVISGTRKTNLMDWVQRFVPQEVAVFNDAPFKRYTIFEVADTIVNGGGLEHQDSQMDEVALGALDRIGPSLYSHEFFHAWNVKRLRPADLVPYRYDDTQPTRWLWVSEGITDYYAQVALVRARLETDSAFNSAMMDNVSSVMGSPAVSVADASLQSWISPTDGTGGIYYPKGAAIGFLLDILIRDASNRAHSLDDVMRDLYATTYKKGRGFTSAEWWSAVRKAANGKSFAGFAKHYVDGRDPLPVDSVLALAGMRTVVDTIREPRFGITTAPDSGQEKITSVAAGGAAAAAGLMVNDRFVSIAGIAIRDVNSFAEVRTRYAGTSLTAFQAVIRRDGREMTIAVPVRLALRTAVRIAPLPNAPEKARALYRGLIAPR